jgi:Zn-dependent protease
MDRLTFIVLQFGSLAFAIVCHEAAHGWMARRCGDPTAERAGRITLNPLAHVDLVGSIILPVLLVVANSPVLFGWAKPVPFNPMNFRNVRKGVMLVGAAGPLANFALALLAAAVARLMMLLPGAAALPEPLVALPVLLCLTNLMLGLFNLIPIPPLDGSRVVLGLLPPALARSYLRLEPFGFLIVFGLLWLGVFDRILHPLMGLFSGLLLAP